MRQVTASLRTLLAACALCSVLGGTALAADPPAVSSDTSRVASLAAPSFPTADLADLLREVERKSSKSFLVDARVPEKVVVGTYDPKRVTYPVLLSILRNNGCAAVTVQGVVNVIPYAGVRTYPLPILNKDGSIADDDWITRIIRVKQADAAQLVPILRPLLPQEAHLAAMSPSNSLIIADRYANVKRITEIVQALDVTPTRPPPQ
jgi:type II secretory pathway component GspD/PulD (secretin)